jgi:cytochrome c oxidase cbb3-type subunit 3
VEKILVFFLTLPVAAMAQNNTGASSPAGNNLIGGLSPFTFYVMVAILFLEMAVVLVLIMNIRMLIRKEKSMEAKTLPEPELEKKTRLSWWDRFNKLRPVSQEAELDLGHEYDGIRELDNRLPPWWLYGFYATIIFAGIYLWRFHVSHNGPSSTEEYEQSVARAEIRIQEYLKQKGESVDENTVTFLADAADIDAGKALYTDPSKCATCHGIDGGGAIGPNLTDNYWLYGGSINDIFKTIKYGTSKGMRAWKDDLSPKQMAQVASYIKSIVGSKPAAAKEAQGQLYEEVPVKPATDSLPAVASQSGERVK